MLFFRCFRPTIKFQGGSPLKNYFYRHFGVSQEIPQREAKHESKRSKVESRNVNSESPSELHPINVESDLGIARFESHDSESLDSRFRIANSVPLRAWPNDPELARLYPF